MWNEHLGRDVGEFWIRTEKYLTFHLQGTEYPPFAMLYFLLLRWAEFTFQCGLREELCRRKLRAAGAAPGRAQPSGGTPGGPPLRCAHARGRIDSRVPLRVAGFVSDAGGLVRLALQLAPLRRGSAGGGHLEQTLSTPACSPFCPPASGGDVRRQVIAVGSGLGLGLAGILLIFWLGGDPISSFSGVVRFHENKPVGLESTPATLAMAFDAIRGAWPSHSVNEYSIHGLRLPAPYRWLMQLGLLTSLGALLYSYWKRGGNLILTAQAMLVALIFWTTLFQPQYLDLARGLHSLAVAYGLGGASILLNR